MEKRVFEGERSLNLNKETFRKIEDRLYSYFKQLKFIEKDKQKIILLKKQQEEIKEEMKCLKALNIDSYTNMGIDYSRDSIQISPNGAGEGEIKVIQYITDLEKEYERRMENIYKLNSRVRDLEIEVEDMKHILEQLDEEQRKFIKLKYRNRKSVEWIAIELMGGAKSTAYRKRDEIIRIIAEFS